MRQAPLRIFPAQNESAPPDRSTLQRLADQVADIAHKMSRLEMDTVAVRVSEHGLDAQRAEVTPAMLYDMLAARRARARYFSNGLFADPAWDILLDLLLSRLSQTRVSVTSVCVASNVPSTTALRWIRLLENEGLVSRRADHLDGRRFYIELTDQAETALCQYFTSVGLKLII